MEGIILVEGNQFDVDLIVGERGTYTRDAVTNCA
jgi:hypothetical protein